MADIFSRDGTRIACRSEGKGPPLVLVHGSGTDGGSWNPVLPSLVSAFTVIAMDRRGHGRSSDAQTYSIAREYEDVIACIDSAGGDPVDVAGHSYGGLCALGAARAGGKVRRLILFEPPIPTYPEAYYPADLIEKMTQALAADDRDGAMVAFAKGVFGNSDEEIADMKKLVMWQQMARTSPRILRELKTVDNFVLKPEEYRGWNTPTLLLLGSESPPQYRATIEALHAALPGSRIGVLEGQQHSAMKTAPALFAQTILDFLKPKRKRRRPLPHPEPGEG